MGQSGRGTPRKRGRPSILKNYGDPMKSPMAYSSLQVQRSAQSFNKPLMRIPAASSAGAKFKTPVRKTREGSGTISFAEKGSPPSSSESGGSRGTLRFRSVVVDTPRKGGKASRASSPLTPCDNVFSSASRAPRSSPPAAAESPLRKRQAAPEPRFKFALSIDESGKACISGVADAITCAPASAGSLLPSVRFDKRRVLGLLRQMSKKPALGAAAAAEACAAGRPLEPPASDSPPCSPPPNTSTIPLTPRCTSVFQFKTGFTPCNVSIDELLRSPQVKTAAGDKLLISSYMSPGPYASGVTQQDRYVFKVSSGDPLLMNDDDSELLGHVGHDPAELFHAAHSPRRPICFNTPPSWVNIGSPPRSASMLKLDHAQLSKGDEQPLGSESLGAESGTPFHYTPLIQQAMSGTFSKYHAPADLHTASAVVPEMHTAEKRTLPIEYDDARLALKKLIKRE
ncbi:AaceriADR209Wp [[Ashbya] aceris (nom. inval.)]|nr:AaceriADR209Wp [[Ashbya] aceris (nom. inval.)]